MASGSATGNPRNKVALKPGRSLMDWIRLCNSGVDMSGCGGAVQVSPQLLASHNNLNNTPWTAINGKVYNIGRYLEFHPGGEEELLKGAGRDATTLFNNVHPWVNYEGILGKCLVGRLTKGSVQPSPFLTQDTVRLAPPKPQPPLRMDWYQKKSHLTIVLYTKKPPRQVSVYSKERELWARVKLLGEEGGECMGWDCEGEVGWPPCITSSGNKVELLFEKVGGNGIWSGLPTLTGEPPSQMTSCPAVVSSVAQLNHNVYLVLLNFKQKVHHQIPIGSHLLLSAIIAGVREERPYTPISSLIEDEEEEEKSTVRLLVKRYHQGVFSTWLTTKGSEVMVSTPEGNFNVSILEGKERLLLLAAGTGITPMVNIIKYAALNRIDVQLKYFNRTEADIIWRDELDNFSKLNPRLVIEDILSEGGEEWSGRKGSLTLDLLESFLSERRFVIICGPHPFTHMAKRYMESIGLTKEEYFSF